MDKKIAVVGAGAIGATIGAYLIKDGYDVTLIDQWAAHIEKIRTDGLKLTALNGEFTVPAKALNIGDVSGLREQFDVVFLSVKAYDTRWSTYLIQPHLKLTGFMLPTQNGLTDEEVAGIVGFRRTVGCVPTIGAAVYTPGHVIRTDPLDHICFSVGELTGLITPRVQEVVNALEVVGYSEGTTNIWGLRWTKLIINSANNALSGIIGPSISLNEEQQDVANLIKIITCSEAARVGFSIGLSIEPIWGVPAQEFAPITTVESAQKLKDKMVAIWSKRYQLEKIQKQLGVESRMSLLQDLMKGRRTEVEFYNGVVVRKGKETGVPTPMNQALLDLTLKIENGEASPGLTNLKLLKNYLPV